jgi:hypothetical protein
MTFLQMTGVVGRSWLIRQGTQIAVTGHGCKKLNNDNNNSKRRAGEKHKEQRWENDEERVEEDGNIREMRDSGADRVMKEYRPGFNDNYI